MNALRWLAGWWLLWWGAAFALQAVPAPPRIEAKAYALMDFHSGQFLAERDADTPIEPASLTKIMTVYAALHEIKAGHLSLDDRVTVSERAWKTGGSRMFIEVGKQVPVKDLLLGIIVQSGNDACVALAEHIAGSEEAFAALMNEYAKALGLEHTHFANSTGLPHPDHYTTARDLAILTRALIREFPEAYKWFAIKKFTHNGITQYNRNKLLWRDPTVDGVKTGHTQSAGYCLVASAKRGDMRLISVVAGAKTEEERLRHSAALLNYGFRFFETHRLYEAGKPLATARVWKGAEEDLPVGLAEALYVTVPRGTYGDLSATLDLDPRLMAPVDKGQAVGKVKVTLKGEPLIERPLIALRAIPEGSFWQRWIDQVILMVYDLFD